MNVHVFQDTKMSDLNGSASSSPSGVDVDNPADVIEQGIVAMQ